MIVEDSTGEIRVDIGLELCDIEKKHQLKDIFNDRQNSKRRVLCLRHAVVCFCVVSLSIEFLGEEGSSYAYNRHICNFFLQEICF